MEDNKADRIFKKIMLILVVATITFIGTFFLMNNTLFKK